MRSIFGKYLAPFLVLIIFQLIVIIIVLLQIFKDTNGLARTLFEVIDNWSVSLAVFNFIADYAEIISAIIVCLVLATFFISLKRRHRGRAINRLHGWSRNAVVTLAQYRQEKSDRDYQSEKFEELQAILSGLTVNCREVLADARFIGSELGVKTRKTVHSLYAVEKKVGLKDKSAFGDLQALQHDLADIMVLAFESLSQRI